MNALASTSAPADKGHGLTADQLERVRAVLATCADRITGVDLFGSRATGRWRPNSDLDLLLHGTLSDKDIDRLWTLFYESSLPISVDVKSYDLTTYAPLKRHMDQVRKPLFSAEQLQPIPKATTNLE